MQLLGQLYSDSKLELSNQVQQQITHFREVIEQHAYRIVIEDIKQKQYLQILSQKSVLFLFEEMNEVKDLVQKRNNNTYHNILTGQIELPIKNETNLSLSRMKQSKIFLSQSPSPSPMTNRSFVKGEDEEKRILMANQLIKKKQQQKLQRHSRLQKILEQESQALKSKQEEEKKIKNNIIWMRNQKSLQKYRLAKQRYHKSQIENESELQIIKQFQNKIKSISRASQKDYTSLDTQRNKDLQTSRTEALIQRKKQFKIDYREIDDHGQRYIQKLRELESDRLSRFQQRKSQDFNAMKVIKPFNEVYVPKDSHKQAQQKLNKIKEFKEHVRANVKPTIDIQKRKQLLNSIVTQDSARYRSLGIMKEEVDGKIIQKQLPKINLRSIGNEYMRHAKKLKSKIEHKTQFQQQEVIQKPKLTNYLIDLKKQERRRMSRSQQISKSGAPIKQKIKRTNIMIECLENEIKKHTTLMRNSSGLTGDKIDQLKSAVDTKSLQIANLKLTLMSLLDTQ